MTSHSFGIRSLGFYNRVVRPLVASMTSARRRRDGNPPPHRSGDSSERPGPYGLLGGPWR